MLQSRLIKPVDTLRARGFSCVKKKKRPARKAFGPERHPFDSAEPSTLLIPKHPEFGRFADRFLWDVECFKCSDWITVREARDQDAGGLKVTKIKCKQSISSHVCFCLLEENWKYQMAVRAIAKVIRTFDGGGNKCRTKRGHCKLYSKERQIGSLADRLWKITGHHCCSSYYLVYAGVKEGH